MQIITDNKEPPVAASPIGNNVLVKYFDAKYAPGIRTKTIERKLCKNEMLDFPYAQKYPLKQKCIPAKIQSQIYPRIY